MENEKVINFHLKRNITMEYISERKSFVRLLIFSLPKTLPVIIITNFKIILRVLNYLHEICIRFQVV